MSTQAPSRDSVLERQSRRFRRPAWWFGLIAIAFEVPGILLLVLGHTWLIALGITLIALGSLPAAVGAGLLLSALVTWWAAGRRPFA